MGATTQELLTNWISDHLGLLGFAATAIFALWQVRKTSRQANRARKILKKAIEKQADEPATLHPEIDPALCAGCTSCTSVCPEGDILQIIDHKAVLVSPTKCVGHGECERACPTGAIKLVFGTKKRGMDIPRISTDYETNVPGIYIAGELGGMGLIRNAVKQGHHAAKHALANLKSTGGSELDLLIVGAGPAGLAASLTAIAEKKSYKCIEQGAFGGTIASFPRQKLAMTYPAHLPIVGKMQFPGNKVTKEELMAYWQEVQRKTGLKVQAGVKFETLLPVDGVFQVETSAGIIRARKVILAMGVRGSPRRLGLANENLPKVTYNLEDPAQYQKMAVTVVGGGNAGVEAAQYLARPEYGNDVTLLVRGPTLDRCNEHNQEIIGRMAAAGQVKVWYEASVQEIHAKTLAVTHGKKSLTIPNDFLFIFAGAEMPHKFLMSLGIQIDRKNGESLGKAA